MSHTDAPGPQHAEAVRHGARRTAITVGLVALGIYIAFILSGVIGR
ncbi:MAG: hypothetical protein WCZ65_05380 [Lysobacteraceae bacterium]|jgi:hypothetical protein